MADANGGGGKLSTARPNQSLGGLARHSLRQGCLVLRPGPGPCCWPRTGARFWRADGAVPRARTQVAMFADEEKVSRQMVKWVSAITRESIVDVEGTVVAVENKIEACTQQDVELSGHGCLLISKLQPTAPTRLTATPCHPAGWELRKARFGWTAARARPPHAGPFFGPPFPAASSSTTSRTG